MADDQNQRPYRASEPPARGPIKAHGSDPLAELARLIGQTDPFAEFGREGGRRTSTPEPAAPADWSAQPASGSYTRQAANTDEQASASSQKLGGDEYYSARPVAREEPLVEPQSYGDQNYGRQVYDETSLQEDDSYRGDHEARGYPPGQADYQQEAYAPDSAYQPDDAYYDDVPSSRRRVGIMAIAGVLALAVIGTAGAFGYRAIFGASGSNQPPPVIKADAGPSKIVPATTGKDTQSAKLITDRLNERGESEKLVSREEQPIDRPANVVLSQGSQPSPLGSGVVASEPKKVRTIAIHPDQPAMGDPAPSSAQIAAVPPMRPAAAKPAVAPTPAQPAAESSTADAEPDPGPPPATRPAPPPVRQAAPAHSNAPLSLNPNAPPARASARPAPAPARTASVAAPAQLAPAAAARNSNNGGAGSYVQVSSQRSEADAQAAFRSLQAKFPTQLGGKQPQIHRVDLGAKGVYYRAMVGPFANASQAVELCSSLKAAGGQCLIQRN